MAKKLGKKPPIRPYVATPAYDGKVDTDYAISIGESVKAAAVMGIDVTLAVMGNGAFIDLARNNFVRMFLDTDCTHLFFIDADLRWEARAFVGLIGANRPVCAGMYRRRQEPEEYPVKYKEDDEGGLRVIDGGWVECERVPTGFLCIRRDIIEEMAADAPKWVQHNAPDVPKLFYTRELEHEPGRYKYMGEDFAWCDDYCKRYDAYIPVWPDFDFTHGGYQCNWHEHMNRIVEKHEKKRAIGNG